MSLCLNPNCSISNPDGHKFCEKCGSKLFLQERYQAIKLRLYRTCHAKLSTTHACKACTIGL